MPDTPSHARGSARTILVVNPAAGGGRAARALDLVLDAPGLPGQDLLIDAGESLYARARDVAFEGEPLRTGD